MAPTDARDPQAGPDGVRRIENRRSSERVPILGELRGEAMVFQPMAVQNVGRGGAQIETDFPLQLDSLHEFRLTLGDRTIVVKGRIAHCSISDVDRETVLYRSGVEFVEPSEQILTVIVSFLEALKSGRRAF